MCNDGAFPAPHVEPVTVYLKITGNQSYVTVGEQLFNIYNTVVSNL